jgi:outer membrane receptor protein involved in Fe transport
MTQLRRLSSLAAVSACLGAAEVGDPGPAPAASADAGHRVIVVTATRVDDPAGELPQAVTVVDAQAIERQQARTPNQMLSEAPGAWSTQAATQGSPIIRGQIGNRVLYLWDGVRINNGALFSGPNGFFNQYPLGGIERIEIVRGPGAVQYGSDAIGGVVDIIGKRTEDFPDRLRVGGDAYGRYGSVDREVTEGADLEIAGSTLGFAGGITRQDVGDYRAGGRGGRQENTGFEALGGYANAAWRPADGQTIRLSWIGDDREDVESYSQSKLNASGIPRIFGPYERRHLFKLDYRGERLAPFSSQLDAYAYQQRYSSARDQTVESATAFNTTRTDTDQVVTGGGVQNAAQLGPARLTLGVDYRHEQLGSSKRLDTTTKATGAAVSSVPNGQVPDGTYDVADAYLMGKARVAPGLELVAGLRAETVHLDADPEPEDALAPFTVADLDLDRRWNAVTWSVGSVYALGSGLSLAANVATGFRAPTFSDTLSTGVPVFASGVASVPSPGVGPERSITYEFGPRLDTGGIAASLTGYWTQLSDVIVAQNDGTIAVPGVGTVIAQSRTNSASAYVVGVEADWALRLDQAWTLFGNAAWTRGQDTSNDVPLRFIPPLNARLGLRRESASRRWWAEGVVVAVDHLRRHAPGDELDAGFAQDPGYGSPSATNPPLRDDYRIPGYVIVDLRAGWTVWCDGARAFDLTIDLDNLFDTRYREAYSQQQLYAPGFGVVIGGKASF